MQETWIPSLVQEDPLEEGTATHSSILAWRIPIDTGYWWATVHGVTKSQTQLNNNKYTHIYGASQVAQMAPGFLPGESP